MHDMLRKIIQKKKEELVIQKSNNRFIDVILDTKPIAIIGEVKLASLTHPFLGSKDEITEKVSNYTSSGVVAISVITEKYFFNGDKGFVALVKQRTQLPILQKDFVIDESQVYEAQLLGADAILLIARIVPQKRLQEFVVLAQKLGIEPVVEIVSTADLRKAMTTKTKIIAVNARDLDTFEVDVEKACLLMRKIPKHCLRLGFSGILSRKEIQQYKNAGAKGVLIGTSLMKASDTKKFIRSLAL